MDIEIFGIQELDLRAYKETGVERFDQTNIRFNSKYFLYIQNSRMYLEFGSQLKAFLVTPDLEFCFRKFSFDFLGTVVIRKSEQGVFELEYLVDGYGDVIIDETPQEEDEK